MVVCAPPNSVSVSDNKKAPYKGAIKLTEDVSILSQSSQKVNDFLRFQTPISVNIVNLAI